MLKDNLIFSNWFDIEHWRGDKLLTKFQCPNGIVDVGLHYLLDAGFNDGTKITTWYLGLVDNSGFSAFAAADTLASHSGWTEFSTYTGNRPTWGVGAAATRAVTNASTTDFAITGSGTLKGLFAASVATGTSGTLWATAAFTTTVAFVNGDKIKATYTVSG